MISIKRAELAVPVIFGLSDGMMSLLGVILYLFGHQSLIFPAALMGGISSGISMAAGSWLSDSDDGFGASCLVGGATGTGAVMPALPFAFFHGITAMVMAAVICVAMAVFVSFLRKDKSTGLALAETFGILVIVVLVVLACGLAVPGSGA